MYNSGFVHAQLGHSAVFPVDFDPSHVSSEIFNDVKFIRLNHWRECSHPMIGIPWTAQIYRRFQLRMDLTVIVEFLYRGCRMLPASAEAFQRLLQQTGKVEPAQLESIAEVHGHLAGRESNCMAGFSSSGKKSNIVIDSARVGDLNGRAVLAMWWRNLDVDRKHLSIFMDANGDGLTVHEMHFSTFAADFDRHYRIVADTLRSVQWNHDCPPPICMSA